MWNEVQVDDYLHCCYLIMQIHNKIKDSIKKILLEGAIFNVSGHYGLNNSQFELL